MKRLAIGFGIAWALSGCFSDGGGTDTESLTGTVQPGAASTSLARVKLIPADYNPANPGNAVIRTTQSDNEGRFRFDAVGNGYYNLIAINLIGRVTFAESLRAGDPSPTLSLSPPLTWFIGLRDSSYAPPDSGIAYFPGTDILVRCDGITDAEVDSIPAGLRRIRAESRAGWTLDTLISPPPDSALIQASPEGITITPSP